MYLFLLLAYRRGEDGEYVPCFAGDDFQAKYRRFSDYEQESEHDANALLEHFTFLIYYWYSNSSNLTPDDFRAYESLSEYKVFDNLDGEDAETNPSE